MAARESILKLASAVRDAACAARPRNMARNIFRIKFAVLNNAVPDSPNLNPAMLRARDRFKIFKRGLNSYLSHIAG